MALPVREEVRGETQASREHAVEAAVKSLRLGDAETDTGGVALHDATVRPSSAVHSHFMIPVGTVEAAG